MTILFCTAEELMLTTMEFRFRKQGWIIEVVSKVSALESAIAKCAPDMAIVDLQMPDEQGLQILQLLKKQIKSELPVLALSTLDETGTLLKALEFGAGDFITKPFKPDEMTIRIRRILQEQKVTD